MMESPLFPIITTILIEGLVAYIVGYRSREFQINLLFVNLLTNSILTFINIINPLSIIWIIFYEFLILLVEFLLLKYLLNLPNKKLIILVTLINLVSFSCGILIYFYQYNHLTMMIKCKFSKDPIECIQQEIILSVYEDPGNSRQLLNGIYNLWQFTYPNLDRRYLSDTIHEIGMLLSQKDKDLNSAIDKCPLDWYSGCIHGTVMEYIEKNNLRKDDLYLSVCDSLNAQNIKMDCIHGVGHIIWTAKSGSGLNEALTMCDKWLDNNFSACVSGILMEYSKGASYTGGNQHSSMKVNTVPLPCKNIEDKYKATCYITEASYREYYPNSNIISDKEYCHQLPTQYINTCLSEIDRRLSLSGLY